MTVPELKNRCYDVLYESLLSGHPDLLRSELDHLDIPFTFQNRAIPWRLPFDCTLEEQGVGEGAMFFRREVFQYRSLGGCGARQEIQGDIQITGWREMRDVDGIGRDGGSLRLFFRITYLWGTRLTLY